MCSISFALGRWRAERRRPAAVALAPHICRASYDAGFSYGRSLQPPHRGSRR
ncbi:hypothetical protein [Methylobacterium soli]|uniref:hypothetical protein n=1 Tax=Methylobacterium soli TaxID=553447 RepID=UPI0017842DF9|nr:hypothetical protein [Methylobacterium soli]